MSRQTAIGREIKKFIPRVFRRRCARCRDDVRGEAMWTILKHGWAAKWRDYLCLDCAPTMNDAARFWRVIQ